MTDHATGSSSNHALFRNLSRGFSELARRSRLTVPNQTRGNAENPQPGQAPPERHGPSSSAHAHSLPAYDELFNLLDRFFTTVGAVIPCVDEPAFLGYWRECSKDKSIVIPRTAYALVNIIMAHASATIPDGNPLLFYHRSLGLLDISTVQGTDIHTGMFLVPLKRHLESMADKVGSPNFVASFSLSTKPSAIHRELDHTQFGCQSCFSAWNTLAGVLRQLHWA